MSACFPRGGGAVTGMTIPRRPRSAWIKGGGFRRRGWQQPAIIGILALLTFTQGLRKELVFRDPEAGDETTWGVKNDTTVGQPPGMKSLIFGVGDHHGFPYTGGVQEGPRRKHLDNMVRVALILRNVLRDSHAPSFPNPILDDFRLEGNDIVVDHVYLAWIQAFALEDWATRIDRICLLDPAYDEEQAKRC